MTKRPNLGLWFAVMAGALYVWKWRKIEAAQRAALANPTTVSGSVAKNGIIGS